VYLPRVKNKCIGVVNVRMTSLLTTEDLDKATKVSVAYKAPGTK